MRDLDESPEGDTISQDRPLASEWFNNFEGNGREDNQTESLSFVREMAAQTLQRIDRLRGESPVSAALLRTALVHSNATSTLLGDLIHELEPSLRDTREILERSNHGKAVTRSKHGDLVDWKTINEITASTNLTFYDEDGVALIEAAPLNVFAEWPEESIEA
jgi:hypothetical protein